MAEPKDRIRRFRDDFEHLKFNDNGAVRISDDDLSCKIDEVDSTTTYIGNALIGSLTTAAVWKIKKISVSGTVTSIQYADSNKNYDNIWDNRGSLIYG